MIIERDLQPFESFVFLASHGVNLSDLIGESIPSIGDEIGQCRVCRLTITADVLRDREFETAKAVIRLQLRFAQGRLAVAALGSDRAPAIDDCEAPAGCNSAALRASRVCFIQFSGKEKNSRQIDLASTAERGSSSTAWRACRSASSIRPR